MQFNSYLSDIHIQDFNNILKIIIILKTRLYFQTI